MPTSKQRFEQQAAQIAALANKPLTEQNLITLQNALLGSNNFLAAEAAAVIAKQQIEELVLDLPAAFDYFMDDGPKRDKGCLAKTAIVKAMVALNSFEEGLYLKGVGYRQMEPVYGGQADTAADLRSQCLAALLQMSYGDIQFEVVNLLNDSEVQCRVTAVAALVAMANENSEVLLRFKCLAGDDDPKVIDNCFAGLLEINLGRSLPFVAEFAAGEDDVLAESAALALGETSDARAYRLLAEIWEASVNEKRRTAFMLPIALTRQDEALKFLLETIKNGPDAYAKAALNACHIYDYDERFQKRVEESLKARPNKLS